MKLFLCVLYCAAIGILSNPIAALLPRSWFDPEKAPYASFSWEQDGRIYNRLVEECSYMLSCTLVLKYLIHLLWSTFAVLHFRH